MRGLIIAAMTDKPECTCPVWYMYNTGGHRSTCPVASWIAEKDGGHQPCAGGKTLEGEGTDA